jgi:hypothetical protein
MLESIGMGRNITVFLIGHFNPPTARARGAGSILIKVFSTAAQHGTPQHDVPSREQASASPRRTRRSLMMLAR